VSAPLKSKAPEKASLDKHMPDQAVLILGAGYGALKIAEDMAQSGIPVVWVTGAPHFLELPGGVETYRTLPEDLNFQFRPLYLRVTRHPLVTPLPRSSVESIEKTGRGFKVAINQSPQFIDYDLCTGCAKCLEVCPLNDFERPPLSRTPEYCPSRALQLDKRKLPPCRTACPLGVNVQAYMALSAAGRFDEALAVIREVNPLPGVCGRVCHHPCEDECRRKEIEKPLAIRDVKRFLYDYEAEQGPPKISAPEKRRKERVAVIGSGPAGLTAAHFLNQAGLGVTIFESLPEAGGMLRAGINSFRMPRQALDAEIGAIAGSGVEIVTGHVVDDIKKLFDDGFKAVLIATGTHCDLRLNVPGENLPGVVHCVEFLSKLNLTGEGAVGARTLVIGGGNSAMDAARTALRLGAHEVTVLAIEKEEELPANPREVDEAREEGVVFKLGFAPVSLEGKDKVEKVVFRAAHWEFPEDGPPRIEFDSDDVDSIEVDTVIVTIGQRPDLSSCCLDQQIDTDPRGRVSVDEALCASMKGVFASGDAVTGPTTVVGSMASGRMAAGRIISYLTRAPMPFEELFADSRGDGDWDEISEDVPTAPRQEMAQRQPRARRRDFDEVSLGLTASQAVAEAKRCLQCGACCECLACEDACADVGAIDHYRQSKRLEIISPAVIVTDEDEIPDGATDASADFHYVSPYRKSGDLMDALVGASAVAGKAMPEAARLRVAKLPEPRTPTELPLEARVGFFVCSCNGTLTSQETLTRIRELADSVPGIEHSEIIFSICNPGGADLVAKAVRDKRLSRVVLAACMCCPLEFHCISCNDQRSRAKLHLFERLGLPRSRFETINFRDILKLGEMTDDQIVERARTLLRSSFIMSRYVEPLRRGVAEIGKNIIVLGGSEIGTSAAMNLAHQGFKVRLVHRCSIEGSELPGKIKKREIAGALDRSIKLVKDAVIEDVRGELGNFTVAAQVGGVKKRWKADVVCVTDEHLIPLTISEQIKGLTKLYRHDFSFFHTPRMGLYRVMPRTLKRVGEFEAGAALAAEVATTAAEAFLKDHLLSPEVDPERCRGCGRCEDICPFNAVELLPNDYGGYTARVIHYNCVGCGGCVGRCPVTAMDMPYFSNQALKEIAEDMMSGEKIDGA